MWRLHRKVDGSLVWQTPEGRWIHYCQNMDEALRFIGAVEDGSGRDIDWWMERV